VKTLRTAFLLVLLTFGFGGSLRSTETALELPLLTRTFPITVGLGINASSNSFTAQVTPGSTVFTNNEFRIQVTETANRQRSILRVRVDHLTGTVFGLTDFFLRVRVPKPSIGGIWFPGSDANSKSIISADANNPFLAIADANFGIPYVGAMAVSGRTSLALGFGHQDQSVVLKGTPLDDGFYEFELRSTTDRMASSFEERFYVSNDSSSMWFETAANYTDWVDAYTNYKQFPISTKAYLPVYDTWYWSGDRVNDDLYLKTSEAASQLGMGLYLADSGWDTAEGEYDQWLAGRTGDYSPPPYKFPDLYDTFRTIRSKFGMGIHLWLQPFAIGRQSERYPPTSDLHIHIPDDHTTIPSWSGVTNQPIVLPIDDNLETVNLCPRMSGTSAYLKELFSEMAMKYHPEGYWLDFIDGMATFCVASHQHSYSSFGEGFRNSLEAIKSTILAHNPDAVVHFRARYANLNTKSYANVWQSEDSPRDFDLMRLNAIRLRPFSKGVVFAADQLFWPPGLPDATVSKFVMTSVMTGVPAFGLNLLYSTESEKAIIAAWLGFYRNNAVHLIQGRFVPFGSIVMPNHKIEGQDRTYVYLRTPESGEITAGGKTVYLMNATDQSTLNVRVRVPAVGPRYVATIYNRFLVAQPGPITLALAQSRINVRLSVEEGGMIALTPLEFGLEGLKKPSAGSKEPADGYQNRNR